MITAIEIENFKGIRDRVRVELRPVTLLFGPNSAGKSTILHALHYAREVFERRNLDADRTAAGGRFVDLGGFRNFVHNREVARPVILHFELDLKEHDLPTYYTPGGMMAVQDYELPEVSRSVERASVEVAVAWSELREALYVRHFKVGINGEPLATIVCEFDRRQVELTHINYRHPVLPAHESFVKLAEFDESQTGTATFSFWGIEQLPDALPRWGQALRLAMMVEPGTVEAATAEMARSAAEFMDLIIAVFSQLVVGPGELVAEWLQSFHYLGPVRETPPRDFRPPRTPDPSRWASGIAAWDMLLAAPEKLVQNVSAWLSHADRLNTGYRLERRRCKRLDAGDPLVLALISGRAFDEVEAARIKLGDLPTESELVLVPEDGTIDLKPPDVGIGISQILPVVAASVGEHERLVLIEQPELHVHPRVQAELGDLFIETSMRGPHSYILETHSEHLILRIMRRIRETGEGKPHNGFPVTGDDVAVYYVSVEKDHTALRRIDIDRKGEFIQPWPDDFFEIDFYERFGHAG